MPELIQPRDDLRRSFAAAMAEFAAEGRGGDDDHTVFGGYIRSRSAEWADDEAFRAFAASIRAEALEESPRPEGFVPATELWWVDGNEFLGRIVIRHRLTPRLLEMGGHIGYDVRPSARRRGHATEMLRQALGLARDLGIERALITCDVDNVGSRTVIERNGGVLEDERAGKLRFWAPTGRGGMPQAVRSRAAILVVIGAVVVIAVAVVALVMNDGRGPASATGECPEGLPQAFVDDALGMALCLPANWRDIRADDEAAWRELYGELESSAEQWIRDETMDHFIVPLEPRDEDPLVNLAIYSRAVEPATELSELREAYVVVLESTGSTIEVTDMVDLEAGPAVLIEGERLRDSEGSLVVDRYLDWIVVHDDVAFYVLFASDRTFADHYRATFEAVANSVRFTDPPGD